MVNRGVNYLYIIIGTYDIYDSISRCRFANSDSIQ